MHTVNELIIVSLLFGLTMPRSISLRKLKESEDLARGLQLGRAHFCLRSRSSPYSTSRSATAVSCLLATASAILALSISLTDDDEVARLVDMGAGTRRM